MVAAAGFILQHENRNDSPTMVLALTARKRWEQRNSFSPSPAGRTLKTIWGTKMNIPFHGNQSRAKSSAVPPSTRTSVVEKMTPLSHFTRRRRNRETGRDR